MINMESLDRRFQEVFRLFETAELVAMREHLYRWKYGILGEIYGRQLEAVERILKGREVKVVDFSQPVFYCFSCRCEVNVEHGWTDIGAVLVCASCGALVEEFREGRGEVEQ